MSGSGKERSQVGGRDRSADLTAREVVTGTSLVDLVVADVVAADLALVGVVHLGSA